MLFQNQNNNQNQKTQLDKEKIKRITNILTKDIVPTQDHSFEAGLTNNLTTIMSGLMVPWLLECITKYSEQQFHDQMKQKYYRYDKNGKILSGPYMGMDFIGDWYKNHKQKFRMFIFAARVNRRWFKFDLDREVANLVYVMETETDPPWTVYEHEKIGLYQSIEQVHNLIYKSKVTTEKT